MSRSPKNKSKSRIAASATHGSKRLVEEVEELAHGVTTTADALEIVDRTFGPDTLMPSQYLDMVQVNKFDRDGNRELRIFFAVLVEALNCIGGVDAVSLQSAIADYNRSLALCATAPLLPRGKNSRLYRALLALVWLNDDSDNDIMSARNVCEWLELDLAKVRLATVKAIREGRRYRLRYMSPVTRRRSQIPPPRVAQVASRGKRVKNRREGKFHAKIVKHHDRQAVQA